MSGLVAAPGLVVPLGANQFVATASGVLTIQPPAGNTKGLILRHLSAMANNTIIQAYADTAAPAGTNDVTKRRILDGLHTVQLLYPLFIPAGNGLWVLAGINFNCSAGWDLLP